MSKHVLEEIVTECIGEMTVVCYSCHAEIAKGQYALLVYVKDNRLPGVLLEDEDGETCCGNRIHVPILFESEDRASSFLEHWWREVRSGTITPVFGIFQEIGMKFIRPIH